MDGRHVLTIEGVGSDGALDSVQQAFVDHGALQCGFCTPGMVLTVKALLAEQPAVRSLASTGTAYHAAGEVR